MRAKLTEGRVRPVYSGLLAFMLEKTNKIIEQAPIGIITFSKTGEIDYVNQNVRKLGLLYHLEIPAIFGENIFTTELFPNISIQADLQQLLEGLPFEKELNHIITSDGRQIDLILKGSPIYEKDKFIGGLLLLEDIKILKETKDKLELKADYIEKAFHKINDVFIVTNSKLEIQFAGGSALKNLNLTDRQINGKNIVDLFGGDAGSLLSNKIETVRINEEPAKFIFEVKQDKTIYCFNCNIEPVFSKRGVLQLLFFFFNNITTEVEEKKKLTRKIDELNYYKSIVNNLSNALFVLDNKGNITYWDEQSEKLFGLKKSEALGTFFGSTLELFDKRFFENIKNDLKKEKIWKVNLNIFGKEHAKEIFEAKFSYADNKNSIIVMCTNVTRKVKEELELKSFVEEFKKIVANTDELICKINNKGEIFFANQTFLERLGYLKEEIDGKDFKALIAPDYFEHNIFDLKAFDKLTSTMLELPLITKTGTRLNAKAIFIPDNGKNGELNFICYLSHVIKEEPKDENELLYPSLFTASIDGIAVESDGRVLLANDSFAKIFGYDKGEKLAGKDLLDLVSNDDILKVAEYFRLKEHGKNAPDRFEFLGKKRDNSHFYTELAISSFEQNDRNFIVMVTRDIDRKSTRLNSSHIPLSRMPSSA